MNKYTEDTYRQAVRMAISGTPNKVIAEELKINRSTLNWIIFKARQAGVEIPKWRNIKKVDFGKVLEEFKSQ